MKRIEDFIKNVNEKLDKNSNKLSNIIAKLQEIEKEIGDVEVFASTQDGAFYAVMVDDISVQDNTKQDNKKVKCVYIE